MLTLYTWKTPNGYKVPIFLEETGLAYEIKTINISKGEQMTPEYLKLNPNNKIPALVDDEGVDGPITIFESGAILLYLAEKTGKLMPKDVHGKYLVTEWLMFQMAGVGPMIGQLAHFVRFAPEPIEYAINRYTDEVKRLMNVMNTRLGEAAYLGGEYSIADISTWTWIRALKSMDKISFADYPNVERWFGEIDARPAAQAGIQKVDAAADAATPAAA